MRANRLACLVVAVVLAGCTGWAQSLRDLTSPIPLPAGATMVIGFLGGFEPWNDEHRGVRKLVLKLRGEPGVFAESIGNHRRKVAMKYLRRALDADGNGRLDVHERESARIVLFGQSWGGAAVVKMARDLERMGVPVLLTVQVDSVGAHDGVIPANVAAAVNFYQHDPLTIWGRREIRAADSQRTRILGNFAATYLFRPTNSPDASWARRKLGGGHARMEVDPETWTRVARYIDDAIERH